jgi:hypothetical protein
VGNKASALADFKVVLARDPAHPVARSHALVLALELNEPETARRLASGGVLDLVRDGRTAEIPQVWERLDKAGLARGLSDRALAEIARVCLASEASAPLGVQVVREMLDAEVPSSMLPGLLWRVAEVQAGSGRSDLAARTQAMLIERFPMDPFADRARAELGAARARAPEPYR